MADWERFELDGYAGYAKQLVSRYGAELLSGPPSGFGDVPTHKALVWVVHGSARGPDAELAYYLWNDSTFGQAARDSRAADWLLLDREVADRLLPEVAEMRRNFDQQLTRDAEDAAHPDNLLPVARTSRFAVREHAKLLRRYAAALLGELDTGQWAALADILESTERGARMRRIAAGDLRRLADQLDSWAAGDYVALIDLGPERDNLSGPLPPFPHHG